LWRNAVQGELRRQHVQSLYGELEKMLSPPAPPPEPIEVIEPDPLGSPNFFDDDFNPHYYADKLAGKFKQ
jgi:hypothetical protein